MAAIWPHVNPTFMQLQDHELHLDVIQAARVRIAAENTDVHDVGPVLQRGRAEEREEGDRHRAEVQRIVRAEKHDAGLEVRYVGGAWLVGGARARAWGG